MKKEFIKFLIFIFALITFVCVEMYKSHCNVHPKSFKIEKVSISPVPYTSKGDSAYYMLSIQLKDCNQEIIFARIEPYIDGILQKVDSIYVKDVNNKNVSNDWHCVDVELNENYKNVGWKGYKWETLSDIKTFLNSASSDLYRLPRLSKDSITNMNVLLRTSKDIHSKELFILSEGGKLIKCNITN